jgi:hypothetical protein
MYKTDIAASAAGLPILNRSHTIRDLDPLFFNRKICKMCLETLTFALIFPSAKLGEI